MGESVLSRAARILRAFTPDEPELSVSEIGRRAGLHVATASRLIAEMVEQGLLQRGRSGRVRTGVQLWELAQRASPTLGLREAAMPFLEDLHAVIGHHAQIGVLEGREVLFVERLSARDAVINVTRVAGRLPLNASSAGLVLLRDAGAVVYLDKYDTYALARYEHVHAALTDWQRFPSSAGVGLSNFRYEKPWRPPSLLLEADPPRHDAPRRVLARIIGPRALHGLRSAWAAAADELVDELVGLGSIDAVPQLAEAFPLRVFPDAVGIPRAGRENLLPYGDHLFNAFGPPNELVAKGATRAPSLLAWVIAQCDRSMLSPDGFGAAIWAAADRGELTSEQAPLVVRSLLSAGVDTTVHALSAVLYAFATHPGEWRRLREQPSLARVAFDEAVRWESPVQTFFRTAATEVSIEDTVIPDGKKILMFLGAANRDPRRWPDPDRFDPSRDPSGHVGFGTGLHQCVGQHIARLEAESVLTALARRVSRLELAGPVRRHHNNTLRAWASIPLTLHPGSERE